MVKLSLLQECLCCLLVSFTLQIQVLHAQDVVSQLKLFPNVTMIDATWELQEPTAEDLRYLVSWIPDGVSVATASCYVDSPATSTSACDVYPTLDSCTLYTVTVQPTALDGGTEVDTGTPASAADYTLQDGPVAVTKFTCDALGQSIPVSWDGPGACVEYFVSYTGVAMWGDQQTTHDNITTRETSVNFTGLMPYANYSINLSARDEPHLATCVTQTDEAKPSAPLNLTFEAVQATSFTATWLKPRQENGLLGDYQVRWWREGGNATVQNVTETRLEITGLNACDTYTVAVAATTGAGPGDEIQSNQETDVSVPPAGSPPEVSSVASRSVNLMWTKPATKCEVVNYTVVYSGLVMWGNHATLEVNSAYSETTTINIAGLTPYSNYSFSVVAATAAGAGEPSLPTYTATQEDVPSAPTDLNIEALNSTSVLVTWQAPEEENGIITNYTIRWKLAGSGSEENDDQIITTPGDSYECEVPDLFECQIYDFFVSASTSRGEGARTSMQWSPAEEPEAPEALLCPQRNDGSIELSWTAPITTCNITRFIIISDVYVRWSGNKFNSSNSTEESKFMLEDPIPYSNYSFQVKAVVEETVTGAPGACYAWTAEAAPSAPQNLTLLAARSDALVVQWDAPATLNGVVRYYSVISSRGTDFVTNKNITASDDQTRFNCTVVGLSASTEYNISVRAATNKEGNAEVKPFITSLENESGGVAGIVIGCLLGVALVVGLVVVIYKRDDIRKKFLSPPSNFSQTPTGHDDVRTGLLDTVRQFEDDPQKLTTAFEDLNARSREAPKNEASTRKNLSKNRYTNIVPFDDTRVKLYHEWGTDYINASYVKDAVGRVRFIASQGPKPGTVSDFWQMVWQEQVRIIVMLTNCFEGEKEKCCMYWPETRKPTIMADQYVMTFMNEDQGPDWTERRILLQNDPSPAREVVQLHFTSWPDFNVPASEAALLRLISSVRARVGESEPLAPILVHCSAGVGRTGTFIALWNLQQQHQRGAPIDIDATILKIREDRNLLVQSKQQYLFVFKCFAEYLRSPTSFTSEGNVNAAFSNDGDWAALRSHSSDPFNHSAGDARSMNDWSQDSSTSSSAVPTAAPNASRYEYETDAQARVRPITSVPSQPYNPNTERRYSSYGEPLTSYPPYTAVPPSNNRPRPPLKPKPSFENRVSNLNKPRPPPRVPPPQPTVGVHHQYEPNYHENDFLGESNL
ncbi:receptor-type tyrosine-protein phosphatase H-like isoform X1 [Hyalella azteca]|uniref:protein-tyrosine-phosphatase n=1 Tax=Hyalella azteca TaxID=294128 RepID=A0A8B7MYJ5_HYAAZ|nr:receptor-type tyrosine-protein phosphatase H-like isoform X2 [Hyalella azteca]XP_018006647.1 receptor-type tyrosine-protein phosphatase H-like isoform X1 [Hyalella azteca]